MTDHMSSAPAPVRHGPPGDKMRPSELAAVASRVIDVPAETEPPASWWTVPLITLAEAIESGDTGAVRRQVHALQHRGTHPETEMWVLMTELGELLIRRASAAARPASSGPNR